MKKLLLTLIMLTCAHSLQSMELEVPQKLSPISLPQIYSHLVENMNRDIAFHIFSLQPGISEINTKIPLRRKRREGETNTLVERLKNSIYMPLHYCYGYCLTVEILKRNLLRKNISILRKNISICEITNSYTNETILHAVAKSRYHTKDAKLFLEVAGNEVLTLLNTQTLSEKRTALHIAAEQGHIDIVKLFLDAASNNILVLMNILDNEGKTAFDIATQEVKEVMIPYLQNNQ